MARKPVIDQIAKLESIEPSFVTETLQSIRDLRNLGRPGTDAEVKQRIDFYFDWCERTGMRPGIEGLCCALHCSRQTLHKWQHGIGCSPERQQIVELAKSFIATFLEQAGLSGKINPICYVFLSKNWLGYKDSQALELTRADDYALLQAQQTPEQIAAAIEADVPED